MVIRTLMDYDSGELLANVGKETKPLDQFGREIPDPTPVAPPVGYNRQPTMVEHIRAMVQGELLRRAAEESGAETFEEADDFDIPGDEPFSPYEAEFEPVRAVKARKAVADAEAAAVAAAAAAASSEESSGGGGGAPA